MRCLSSRMTPKCHLWVHNQPCEEFWFCSNRFVYVLIFFLQISIIHTLTSQQLFWRWGWDLLDIWEGRMGLVYGHPTHLPNPNPPAVHCGVGQFHTFLATASASDCLVHNFTITMHLKDFWKFSLTEMMFLHSAGYLSLFQSKIIFYLFLPLLSQTLQEELRLMGVLWGFQVATKSQLIELRVPSY